MTWAAVAIGGSSIVGGLLGSSSASKNAKNAAAMAEADRKFQEEQWKKTLMANSPNQSSDFGSSEWTVDPNTGARSQVTKLAAPEAARLGDFRQLAANRMALANALDITKPAKVNLEGYGSNAARDWSGNTGLSGFDPFKGYAKSSGWDPSKQTSWIETNIREAMPQGPRMGMQNPGEMGNQVPGVGMSGHHGMGMGMHQGPEALGSAGGALLGTPGNPAPITPPQQAAPAPAAPVQAPAGPSMDEQIQAAMKKYQDEQAMAAWQERNRQDAMQNGV